MTVTSTVVFGSPPGVMTLMRSCDATTTDVAGRLPNVTVTPPRPGWNPLPWMTTSSPPPKVPCAGSTDDTFRSFEHAAMPNITNAAHTTLTGRIATSRVSSQITARTALLQPLEYWRGPARIKGMATAVLLLTVFVGAAAVRILGVTSIDLLDDRKRSALDDDVL